MTFNANIEFEPKPLWVLSLSDLSRVRSPGRFLYTPPDEDPFEFTVKNRKRQVVDTMIHTEVFCASTVRVGDTVFRLKEDEGVFAETKALSNGRKFYSFCGRVKFIGPVKPLMIGGAS